MRKSKLTVITSSCRKKSNSTYAANYLAGLPEFRKFSAEIFNVNLLSIRPCIGCNSCEKTLRCVVDDDAGMLIKKIEKSDTVIVASPVYFTGVPARLKAFIDRNQVQWNKQNRKSQIRNLKRKTKTGIIILTAGQDKAEYFKPAESEIRSFFAVNNIKTKAVLRFGGMDAEGSVTEERQLSRIKTAARKIRD